MKFFGVSKHNAQTQQYIQADQNKIKGWFTKDTDYLF